MKKKMKKQKKKQKKKLNPQSRKVNRLQSRGTKGKIKATKPSSVPAWLRSLFANAAAAKMRK